MKRAGRVLFVAFAVSMAPLSMAHADITYIGNGTMPDLPQNWGQMNTAICMGAASADIMWYWDQNGYSGLVAHQDPADPNSTWQQDGKALVFTMAGYIYGKDPTTNKPVAYAASSQSAAIPKYIKAQGKYYDSKTNPNGLVVDYYSNGNATYKNWVAGINGGGVLLGGLAWKDGNNKTILQHAMVSAGVDSTGDNLIVTHGWDTHPANAPPYKAPPYAMGEKPFINQYPMEVGPTGQAVIPNPGNGSVDLFGGATYGAAANMTMFEMYNVHPKAKANVKMKAGPGVGFDSNYDSDVSNDSFEPIYQYVQEVGSPVDAMTAPAGWTAVPWNSANTPDVTPSPYESAQPPDENDPLEPIYAPGITGVLYYTTSNPILPGEDLDGFSLDTSQAYSGLADNSLSIVSDGVSSSIDSSSTGLTSEMLFPSFTDVPEPGTIVLAIPVIYALGRRRARRCACRLIPA